jgi:uncharacterized membrane protein
MIIKCVYKQKMDIKIVLHLSRIVLGIFYILAGINHFWHPDFYLPLIPDYLPYLNVINYFSGSLEIIFGILVLMPSTKHWGAVGIIFLLIAFLPSHFYFINIGACISEGLCVPIWVAWIRLLLVHPLLILWAIQVLRK